jgi:hypothetical protein
VWAPNRVTISSMVMPLELKICNASETENSGPGSCTSITLETNPSRLPVGTL